MRVFCNTILFATFICVLVGCSSVERDAWQIADSEPDNHSEIVKFLNHYKLCVRKDKYRAACYLIANMPNKYSLGEGCTTPVYDLKVINADSLILSLDYSFGLRDTSRFLRDCSFNDFCEYILPHRIANEPLTYYWKWDCRMRYAHLIDSNLFCTAANLNKRLGITIHPDNYSAPVKSYTSLMRTRYGKCDDRAILLTMICRSLGISSAYEFIPQWGNHNNGHSFCTVISNDSIVAFQENENSTIFHRKAAKIYRHSYSLQQRVSQESPLLFSNRDIRDVTGSHRVGTKPIQVPGSTAMCVFSIDGWNPIVYSEMGNFNNLGTGTDATERSCDEAENMGDGILYLPVIYSHKEILPVGAPVIVANKGITVITPDTSTRIHVTLLRKYPLQRRVSDFARNMIGGIFEGANRADFSDTKVIGTIGERPQSRIQTIPIEDSRHYRYIRYRKPRGIFSIAEFRLLDARKQPIPFKPIGEEALVEYGEVAKAFDGAPLTYIEFNGGLDLWVGGDMKNRRNISYIEFAPRNDDNCISPGDLYELFYWNRAWCSLGQKTATDCTITFDNVPKNALLWLRNLTKGNEERPFTYENGRQIWW